MRNFSKLIFQRVVVVSLGILLQIIFVLAGMSWLHEYRRWLGFAMSVLSWGAVITVICSHGNPSYKIAWAVLILAFPVAGPDDLPALRRQPRLVPRGPEDGRH